MSTEFKYKKQVVEYSWTGTNWHIKCRKSKGIRFVVIGRSHLNEIMTNHHWNKEHIPPNAACMDGMYM